MNVMQTDRQTVELWRATSCTRGGLCSHKTSSYFSECRVSSAAAGWYCDLRRHVRTDAKQSCTSRFVTDLIISAFNISTRSYIRVKVMRNSWGHERGRSSIHMASEKQPAMPRLQKQDLHFRTPKLTADRILPYHVHFSLSVLYIFSLTPVPVSFSPP